MPPRLIRTLAIVMLAAFAPATFAQLSVLDTERLRIEQGRALAAGREMRAWHFDEFKEPMQDGPAFVIHRGKESAVVQSAAALLPNQWTRVTITLKDRVARLYLDGKVVGENKQFALAPEDVRARAGRIGAGAVGLGFAGKLDDFAVYRTGFAGIADVPFASK